MEFYLDYVKKQIILLPYLGIAWDDLYVSIQFSWIFWDAGVIFVLGGKHE